jgi:hypothetical protein
MRGAAGEVTQPAASAGTDEEMVTTIGVNFRFWPIVLKNTSFPRITSFVQLHRI